MSSAQFNAGEDCAHSEAFFQKKLQTLPKNTTSAAHEKASHAVGRTPQETQQSKDENASFLQQTGEQMANMAQGAIDGVKNTLGMGDKK